jgi:cell division protein FtsB
MLGSLKKEAEPRIIHLAEMAEIELAIASSKLEKVAQENEHARLEKLIPKLESQIKVFDDKNAEIARLKEELARPGVERKKQDKTDSEKLSGKVEALNEVVASLRKDLTDKARTISDLTAENRVLKENMGALEKQKGSDIVAIQGRLTSAESKFKSLAAVGQLGLFSKISESEYTIVIPRIKLVKSTSKGYVLAPGAPQYIAAIADAMNTAPGSRLVIRAHGFGKPVNKEDSKATGEIAKTLKESFVEAGVSESAIEAFGAGTSSPLFSKGAVEENRCVEIEILMPRRETASK